MLIVSEIRLNGGFLVLNSAKFWLGIQDDYDIEEAGKSKAGELKQIRKYLAPVNLEASTTKEGQEGNDNK